MELKAKAILGKKKMREKGFVVHWIKLLLGVDASILYCSACFLITHTEAADNCSFAWAPATQVQEPLRASGV